MARIAVLPGDGIGPQVIREAVKVLRAAADGPAELRANSEALRTHLSAFDAAAAEMARYRVDTPALETRRAAIVAASPEVSRLGRDLLDAAEAGDASGASEAATNFTAALKKLQAAATGT